MLCYASPAEETSQHTIILTYMYGAKGHHIIEQAVEQSR